MYWILSEMWLSETLYVLNTIIHKMVQVSETQSTQPGLLIAFKDKCVFD